MSCLVFSFSSYILVTGKLIDLPGRGNNDQWPLMVETLFSSVPASNTLVSISDPWRAFWPDTVPFKCPRPASCVATGTTENQGRRQVCHVAHYVLRSQDNFNCKVQLTQTLIVRLLKTHFLLLFQKLGVPGTPLATPWLKIVRKQNACSKIESQTNVLKTQRDSSPSQKGMLPNLAILHTFP